MAGLVSRVSFEGLSLFELWPCPFFIGYPANYQKKDTNKICRFFTNLLMSTCSQLACGRYSCSPVIVSFYSVIFTPHTTRKASVGMYSGYDSYIIISINPVSLLFVTSCHPYFILQFYSIVFILVPALFIALSVSATTISRRWEVLKFTRQSSQVTHIWRVRPAFAY